MTEVFTEHFVLDSGALIQLERGDDRMIALFQLVLDREITVTIPRTVLAEVWRGGPRQARLARLVNLAEAPPGTPVTIDELTVSRQKEIGKKIGECGHDDIVDVNVALCARNASTRQIDSTVVTADRTHLERIDNDLKHAISDI